MDVGGVEVPPEGIPPAGPAVAAGAGAVPAPGVPAAPPAPGGGGPPVHPAPGAAVEDVVERLLQAAETNGAAGSGISAMSTEGLSEITKIRIGQVLHAGIHGIRDTAKAAGATADEIRRWDNTRKTLMAIAVTHVVRINGLLIEGTDAVTRTFTGWLPRHSLEAAAVYLVLTMSWEDPNCLSYEDPGLTSEQIEAVAAVTARGAVTNLCSQARVVMTASKVTYMQCNHHTGVIRSGEGPTGALGKIHQAMPDGLLRGSNTEQITSTMWRIAHYASTHKVWARGSCQWNLALANTSSGMSNLVPWGDVGPVPQWSLPWETLQIGEKYSFVMDVITVDVEKGMVIGMTYPCGKVVRASGPFSWLSGYRGVTILAGIYGGCNEIHSFTFEDPGQFLGHGVLTKEALYSAVETCSGMGVSTMGIKEAGIQVIAANDKSCELIEAYGFIHDEVRTVHGDICHDQTLTALHRAAPDAAVLLAGFSCQPFSTGGSQKGGLDSRACSLPGVLRAALLLRKPIIVLECVTSAATNRFVRSHLDSFCAMCGYQISEVNLKLEEVWVSKRDRWWAVLMVGALGPFRLRGWFSRPFPSVVKDVLPHAMSLTKDEADQLVIHGDELEKLSAHCHLQAMELPRCSKCPTALHSWGSQVLPCPCGCRSSGFSDATLASRGVFGVFMPLDDLVHDGEGFRRAHRHLHPSELAVLTCAPIPALWPPSLRLALCGLGQQASPLQAVWIVGQVRQHLDKLFETKPIFDVEHGFHKIMQCVIKQAKQLCADLGEEVVPMVAVPCPLAQPSLPEWVKLKHEGPELAFTLQFETTRQCEVIAVAHDQVTIGNLRSAEVQINPVVEMWDFIDCLTGECLSNDCRLPGLCVLVRPIEASDLDYQVMDLEFGPPGAVSDSVLPAAIADEISPTVAFEVEEPTWKSSVVPGPGEKDPLLNLSPAQLLEVQLPNIGSLDVLQALVGQKFQSVTRLALLEVQGLLWADDEIRWHLHEVASKTKATRWAVLDPLLATAAGLSRMPSAIMTWFRSLDFVPAGIVSCILVEGHWIPLTWTWSGGLLVCRSWDIQRPVSLSLTFLHEAVSLAVGTRTWNTCVEHRMFSVGNACGVCAIRYVDSIVRGRMLPTDASEAQCLHHVGREKFQEALTLTTECSRPWVWGGGLDPHAHRRLVELLTQHGVPEDMLESRITLMVQALGLGALQKVLISNAPWRGLKSLANQTRPPFQIVLPEELALAVKEKATQGGQIKKKKPKGQGKGTPARPPQLDPKKLRIETGYFVKPDNEAATIVSVADLGPVAEGVALATPAMIDQFLIAGKQVSAFPLAVVLINVDVSRLETDLPWAQLRVPLRCLVNDDPVLVHAVLVQLGAQYVSPIKGKPLTVDVENAACVKIAVYRDSICIPWSEFVQGPVRYILEQLLCLQVCDQEGDTCSCGRWHASQSSILTDPVLDVWRRQWLGLTFKPAPQDQADLFMVNVRYAQQVEREVLEMSGINGLFLEPRSLDGRLPVADFQVLWLHRLTLKEVLHIKQCQPNVLGVARMGSRMGIRVRSEHAVTVGALVKPGMVVLASGTRLNFEVGPVPYGLDRQAIQRMCAKWEWTVRAVNPVKTLDGQMGIMWHVQSAVEPPATLFKMHSGDVLVSKMPDKQNGPTGINAGVIGSAKTMDLCALREETVRGDDPWLNYRDPWSDSLKKVQPPMVVEPPTRALRQVEERIEQAVLAKLPRVEPMEIDDQGRHEEARQVQDARVSSMEVQIQQLVQNQQVLDARIDASTKKADAQVHQLQCQVTAQFDAQSHRMEDMFSKQMDQISMLLAKRARTV